MNERIFAGDHVYLAGDLDNIECEVDNLSGMLNKQLVTLQCAWGIEMARSKKPSPVRPIAPISGSNANSAKSTYIARARSQYTASTDDIEIDNDPDVGIAEAGAWIAAWVWVTQEEAGLCEEETTPGRAG
jgi:hypothetical protein